MHFRCLAEHPAKNRAIFEPATKMANLHVNIRFFQGHASGLLHRSQIERFHNKITGSEFENVYSRLNIGIAGYLDEWHVGQILMYIRYQLKYFHHHNLDVSDFEIDVYC